MDLIYTDAKRVDQGVLSAYSLDLSFGSDENDFEMTLGASEPTLEFGAFVYMEGTEYGGLVDGMKTSTNGESVTYKGRTWHGILGSKIIEPGKPGDVSTDNVVVDLNGAYGRYLTISGDANACIQYVVDRCGLSSIFSTPEEPSGIQVRYKFNRYTDAYSGLVKMLKSEGAKLKMAWVGRAVQLYAEPIVDYTDAPVDGDMATLAVEQYRHKVNHFICLGQGELEDREVIHLYVDQSGQIGDVQYYTGTDEVAAVYENTSVESSEELLSEGIEHLEELRDNDTAEISLLDNDSMSFDIGDILGASEVRSGMNISARVTQKIVKIKNGAVTTDYKIGE